MWSEPPGGFCRSFFCPAVTSIPYKYRPLSKITFQESKFLLLSPPDMSPAQIGKVTRYFFFFLSSLVLVRHYCWGIWFLVLRVLWSSTQWTMAKGRYWECVSGHHSWASSRSGTYLVFCLFCFYWEQKPLLPETGFRHIYVFLHGLCSGIRRLSMSKWEQNTMRIQTFFSLLIPELIWSLMSYHYPLPRQACLLWFSSQRRMLAEEDLTRGCIILLGFLASQSAN